MLATMPYVYNIIYEYIDSYHDYIICIHRLVSDGHQDMFVVKMTSFSQTSIRNDTSMYVFVFGQNHAKIMSIYERALICICIHYIHV